MFVDGRLGIPDDNTRFFVFLNKGGSKLAIVQRRPGTTDPLAIHEAQMQISDWFTDELQSMDGPGFGCKVFVQRAADASS